MNNLITASIGLINCKDEFFLQVICVDEHHYFIPLRKEQAYEIHHTEYLDIDFVDELPL